jgi:hypothetical protein
MRIPPALTASLSLGLILAAMLVAPLAPRPRAGVAVLVAFDGPAAATIIARAGGDLLAVGAHGLAVGRSDDTDFVRRLYAGGATLVVNAAATGFCGLPGVKT